MARPASVWRNSAKGGAWYTTIGGQKKRVAGAEATEEEAKAAWHVHHSKSIAGEMQHCNPLRIVLELYLDYLEEHKPGAYRLAKRIFGTMHEAMLSEKIGDLRPNRVWGWLHGERTWGESTQRTALSYLLGALNWAAAPEQRILLSNPLRGLKRPRKKSRGRTALVASEDDEVLRLHAHPNLADVIEMIGATGTRPGNVRVMTAADVHLDHRVIVLDQHKTAGATGEPLMIPIPPAAVALIQRLCQGRPSGPLFRTPTGRPWGANQLTTAICRLKKRLARRGIKLAGNPYLYGYRHTVATDLLVAGMTGDQVAAVLGHKGTSMINHHYGHLAAHVKTLAAEMGRRLSPDGAATSPGQRAVS